MNATELLTRAIDHLDEVGLKKGSWSHKSRQCFDKDKSPVCGIGALKWAATGSPVWTPLSSHSYHAIFIRAWTCLNLAAVEFDYTIPSGADAFITYNDDEGTSKQDVLDVMRRALELVRTADEQG